MGHACHPIPFFFPTAVWLPHDLSHVVLMRRMIYFVRQFIAAFLFRVVIDMPIVPKRNSVTCGFLVGIWSYYRMFAILRVQIAAKDLCAGIFATGKSFAVPSRHIIGFMRYLLSELGAFSRYLKQGE